MKQLIINNLRMFNQNKKVEHIDYQRVSQCSTVFRVKKWNAELKIAGR